MKYRIVTHPAGWFNLQTWRWWFPFWVHRAVVGSVIEARQMIVHDQHVGVVVEVWE